MKRMLSPFAIAIIAMVFITIACSKESVNKPDLSLQNIAATASVPVSKTPVTFDSGNGVYISAYGGGISFGNSQPHPTTPDPSGIYDGQPISVNYVGWQSSSSGSPYSTINGGYFSILESTSPGAVTVDQLSKYFKSLQNYYKYPDSIAYPAPLGSTTGAGGVKEVRGILVRDHTSPTFMSVMPDTYVYVDPNTPGKGDSYYGDLVRDGYIISFYGPTSISGTVSKVIIKYNGADVVPTSFSLTYLINRTTGGWTIKGNIKMPDGTVILVNDELVV